MFKEKSFNVPRGAVLASSSNHICARCLGNMVRNEYWIERSKGVFVSLEHIKPINRNCKDWEPVTRYTKGDDFRIGLEHDLLGSYKVIWWKRLLIWLGLM